MNDSFKYDVRVRQRMLDKGQLTEAEVQKHLAGLADSAAQAEVLTVTQPSAGDQAADGSGQESA